jgi:Ca-activated chloride channel homolog
MRSSKKSAIWGIAGIALLAIAVSGKTLVGQSASDSVRPNVPAANDPWPEVNLNVVVLDRQGAPQPVDVSGFQLFEDRAERPIHFQGSLDSPVSVVFVIDSSGSMYGREPAIVSAVASIAKSLPAGSEVAGITFADIAFLDLPFTAASSADFSYLNRVGVRGGTALYDAVIPAEDYIIKYAKYPRRSLVIVSDGVDNASHVSRREVFRKMKQPGAPVVYACLPSKARILQSELMAGHINMDFLAKEGGGKVFNLDPVPASATAQIVAAVRSQYVLEFTAADAARDGKAHKLEVRLPIKDVQIHALPVYYAPAK